LRPYLNEKASILVSRMDPKKASNFNEVKQMLLREFKLSPSVYLEKFNSDTGRPQETCLIYSARLAAILDVYLNSRKINKSYDKLIDLLVCDRVKSTLPEGCLKHILAIIESTKENGWLPSSELAEAVDLYFASRWQHSDRPRAGALNIPASTKATGSGAGVGELANQPTTSTVRPPHSPSSNRKELAIKPVTETGEPNRRCFRCGSKTHIRSECPKNRPAQTHSNAKVNTCQVQTPQETRCMQTLVDDVKSPQITRVKDAEVQVCVETPVCDELPVGVHKVQSHAVDDSRVHDECQSVCDAYAKLQYVDVKITDCDKSAMKVLSAVGEQISVICSDVLGNLHVPYVGKVKLRGIVGSPVSADLVKLDVALSNSENDDEYITVLCAVCSEANDDLVLASDVVDSLFGRQIKANVANIAHDDVDDDDAECDDDVSDVIDDHSTTVKNADNSRPNVTDITVDESAANCDSDNMNDCASMMGDKPLSQSKANAETLRQEQLEDNTLKGWWSLAKRGKGSFIEKDGLLYHIEKILGQTFSQLCLPKSRRGQVLELAHDTFGGRLGEKRTRERIRLSFTWPSLTSDCKRYCQTCTVCQKRARRMYRDRVPITPITRVEAPFTHWFVDCLGPILNQKQSIITAWFSVIVLQGGLLLTP